MALDEFTTVLKARGFVSRVNPTAIPVPMEPYLVEARAVLRLETDLEFGESGCSFPSNDKHYICVNAREREERQRFTICHEIAHIVLGLPSQHDIQPWWSAKRPLAERLCDAFAAELLLPDKLFQPRAEDAGVGLTSIEALASDFIASFTATGSRFAATISTPCAFVLSENGKVRYPSRSKALIDARAWIVPQMDLPQGTVSRRARAGEAPDRGETPADVWFDNWERGGILLEEARHFPEWDQTLSLLWFESEEVPSPTSRDRAEKRWEYEGREPRYARKAEEESGLKELDGQLHFPGKRRRR